MKIVSRSIMTGCAIIAASVSSLHALTLTSIDFTAKEGTTWSSSSIRLDFGEGVGMGTVSFQSLNGGSASILTAGAPYNEAPYSTYNGPTTLSNGDIFNPAEEVIFRLQPGTEAGLSGVRMTVTLDSGAFPVGSVFSVRSFGRNASGGYQTVNLVSGLSAADSVQLPTDNAWGPPPAFNETSPGSGQYQAASTGSNATGRAFAITGGTFSVDFLATQGYVGGGEAFTLTVPVGTTVPEPSSLLLGLSAMGVFCIGRRR